MHEDDSAPPNPRIIRPPNQDHVIVGRITSPWGIRGDVKVEILSDDPHRFAKGSTLYLGGKPVKVEHSRKNKGGMVVKLDAIPNRTAAEEHRDQMLTISEKEANPLPEGSYYHYQILDMNVRTDDDEYLGRISEIITTGSNDVYVVSRPEQRDVLVPSLEDVVLDVNIDENLMTVSLPEGLR